MKDHLSLLGKKIRDVVTGQVGVATSISFDLSGCIQAALQPVAIEDKAPNAAWWCDVKRLEVIGDPVMAQPTFEIVDGPSAKPAPASSLPPF